MTKTNHYLKVLAALVTLAALTAMLLLSAPAGAVAPSGKAFAWGYNSDGQLGNGNTGTDSNVPVAVQNLTDLKSVKAGCYHGLALKNDGTVYAWGYGGDGQLGNADNASSNVPVKVRIENVKAISAGCDHNLALKEDGTVWAWGFNRYGQLGNGTSGPGTDSNVPVKVGSLGTGATGVAAGDDFSLALMKDGMVNSWGYNLYGQLGNGTSGFGTDRNTPGPVSNLSNVKVIATDSGGGHVLALLNNGKVKSWGYNGYGQLGNGTDRNTPGPVSNLSNVKAIATGGYHSLALLENGKVKSWGYNSEGELGNGTHGAGTNTNTPTDVIGLTNVRSVSGGTYHSLAVLKSGKARSWGYNGSGELGNGTTSNSDVPVNVEDLSNVTYIDGGYDFTLAATTE